MRLFDSEKIKYLTLNNYLIQLISGLIRLNTGLILSVSVSLDTETLNARGRTIRGAPRTTGLCPP